MRFAYEKRQAHAHTNIHFLLLIANSQNRISSVHFVWHKFYEWWRQQRVLFSHSHSKSFFERWILHWNAHTIDLTHIKYILFGDDGDHHSFNTHTHTHGPRPIRKTVNSMWIGKDTTQKSIKYKRRLSIDRQLWGSYFNQIDYHSIILILID